MTDTTLLPANPAIFQQLRPMIDQCGPNPNKHDLAIILVHACIEHGINTKRGFLNALHDLGLKRGHVATILRHGTGNDPRAHHWRVDEHGIYASHPLDPAVA